MLDVRCSSPQPCDTPEGKIFTGESAWGDDPKGWVVGCFFGEASEAVGEVQEDGMVVGVELFLHVVEEWFEAGAATANGFFEVVMVGCEWPVRVPHKKDPPRLLAEPEGYFTKVTAFLPWLPS